ncbi:MAG TPA: cytochrome b/b6 domain-containing protein [Methyloceanibacter sp.]|nr:cytochrome b/b6 domain-containing protein [Methyloceanibacter sp.]
MLNPDRNGAPREVYVWDPFVRLFHWTLVIAFTVAYVLTDEDVLKIHVWSGYVVGALVVARVIWGFVGPEHARFTDFVYAPGASLRYVRDLILFKAKRHLGHSPGGGAMVVTLLIFLAATVITGLVVYGGDQQAGPLAGMFTKEFGESFEGVHELIANITLALVLAHISAVILASFVFRENLPRSMFTGYKRPL